MNLKSTARRWLRGPLSCLLRRSAGPDALDAPMPSNERSSAEEGAEANSGVMSERFHLALHELCTIELERLPKGAKRVLSVGAQGRWYFDWFEQAVGEVIEHVGIEAFEPRPDDLPPYVTWVVNTADHMNDVQSGSIDMVFAGQTSEHLWADELEGFLCEAHRVLRPDGLLALDSPNRSITERLYWALGGHTIELDPHEMSALLALAGFDVISVAGLWNCMVGGTLLQHEENIARPEIFARRAATGRDLPDDCFVWWINAKKSVRVPDRVALRAAIDDLFARHWHTRVSRGFFAGPDTDLVVEAGFTGHIASTLPFPLHEGVWTVSVTLSDGQWADLIGARACASPRPAITSCTSCCSARPRRSGQHAVGRSNGPSCSSRFPSQLTLIVSCAT